VTFAEDRRPDRDGLADDRLGSEPSGLGDRVDVEDGDAADRLVDLDPLGTAVDPAGGAAGGPGTGLGRAPHGPNLTVPALD